MVDNDFFTYIFLSLLLNLILFYNDITIVYIYLNNQDIGYQSLQRAYVLTLYSILLIDIVKSVGHPSLHRLPWKL